MKRLMIFLLPVLFLFSANNLHAETTIERLVKKIVKERESNDTKVYKIEEWIMKNIRYRSDKKQFNMNERWTLPMETLQRRKGDCEDGSTLIIALAVTAGVPENRLRLYAPIVTPGGLHASIAYQRESDDQWVWVEWTATKTHSLGAIEQRPAMEKVSIFLPLGPYLEVTSLNPFDMNWLVDMEWQERSKEILKRKR